MTMNPFHDRCLVLEARIKVLETALERIVGDHQKTESMKPADRMQQIAREALAQKV